MEKKGGGRAADGRRTSAHLQVNGGQEEGRGGRRHAARGVEDGGCKQVVREYKKHKVSVKFLPLGCPRNAFWSLLVRHFY